MSDQPTPTEPNTAIYDQTVAEQAAANENLSVEQVPQLAEPLAEAQAEEGALSAPADEAASVDVPTPEPVELDANRVVVTPEPSEVASTQVLMSAGPSAAPYDPFEKFLNADVGNSLVNPADEQNVESQPATVTPEGPVAD